MIWEETKATPDKHENNNGFLSFEFIFAYISKSKLFWEELYIWKKIKINKNNYATI